MRTILLTILLLMITAFCLAVPTLSVNSANIKVINSAAILIDHGDLFIQNVSDVYSDNNATTVISLPTTFYGPEGLNDALTIQSNHDLGYVQTVNYSGKRYYTANESKIRHWWFMTITSADTSTVTFRVRTTDLLGFPAHLLSPYELTPTGWVKMSTTAPVVSVNDRFTSMTYTGVTFPGTTTDHIITLGSSNNQELPVELSAFTAEEMANSAVKILWETASETNLSGFYIYRNRTLDFDNAIRMNALIPATNTSQTRRYSFVDREVTDQDAQFYYWLESREIDGSSSFSDPISITLTHNVGGNGAPQIPVVTQLEGAYPNPFNPDVQIRYGLAAESKPVIKIFNARGQMVSDYQPGTQTIGYHTYHWDGKDKHNHPCGSGIYFVRMQAGTKTDHMKIMLIK